MHIRSRATLLCIGEIEGGIPDTQIVTSWDYLGLSREVFPDVRTSGGWQTTSWIPSWYENEMEDSDSVAMHDETHMSLERAVRLLGEVGECLPVRKKLACKAEAGHRQQLTRRAAGLSGLSSQTTQEWGNILSFWTRHWKRRNRDAEVGRTRSEPAHRWRILNHPCISDPE